MGLGLERNKKEREALIAEKPTTTEGWASWWERLGTLWEEYYGFRFEGLGSAMDCYTRAEEKYRLLGNEGKVALMQAAQVRVRQIAFSADP